MLSKEVLHLKDSAFVMPPMAYWPKRRKKEQIRNVDNDEDAENHDGEEETKKSKTVKENKTIR